MAMATGDMDKTIRFWRDLLGMRLVAGLGHPGYRHYFFEISPQDLIAFLNGRGFARRRKKSTATRSKVLLSLTTFPSASKKKSSSGS